MISCHAGNLRPCARSSNDDVRCVATKGLAAVVGVIEMQHLLGAHAFVGQR